MDNKELQEKNDKLTRQAGEFDIKSKASEDREKTLTKELKEAKDNLAKKDKEGVVAKNQAEVGKLIEASKLPKPSQDRLKKQFETAEIITDVPVAIEAERKYVESLTQPSGALNMGGSGGEDGDKVIDPKAQKEIQENLEKGFIRLGLDEKEAKIAASL